MEAAAWKAGQGTGRARGAARTPPQSLGSYGSAPVASFFFCHGFMEVA